MKRSSSHYTTAPKG